MAIDVDGGVLWLAFGRGVRVVGSGDFGRFVVFLPLWGASAASHIRNAAGIPLTDRSVEHRRFIEHRTRNAYS